MLLVLVVLFGAFGGMAQGECPNPGLSFCNLNFYLEDRTGPVCDIVEFEGCEEKFSQLTAESWADFYPMIECYCEQPEVQYFLKTAALPSVILFDQISAEFHHDYSTDDRRALKAWGWQEWTQFAVTTTLSGAGLAISIVSFFGRRELADTQAVTFDFNEIFHVCNAMNVPTSFCNELMSDNSYEFSQICGSELSCVHDLDSLMKVIENAQQTTLAQVESHAECPDHGLGFCLLNKILDGKFGPLCDNLPDGIIIENCEDQFAGMNAEDFNEMYKASGMDCFCIREDVQLELTQPRADVILFDMVVASSHDTLPSRRALQGFHGSVTLIEQYWRGWISWEVFLTRMILTSMGHGTTETYWGFEHWYSGVGRRNLAAVPVVHFDWSNIVQVCSQYAGFDMCEMPAALNVKEFEFLCFGQAECEVSEKDLQSLLKSNHKRITGGF